jgi:hypothetical protein
MTFGSFGWVLLIQSKPPDESVRQNEITILASRHTPTTHVKLHDKVPEIGGNASY